MLEPTPRDTGFTAEPAGNGRPEPAHRCVVCSGPSEQAESCCSLECATRAERELRANTARSRRVNGDPAAVDLRRTIAERNGQLTSALLRWRPRSSDGPPTAASANGGATSVNGGPTAAPLAAPVPVAVVEPPAVG